MATASAGGTPSRGTEAGTASHGGLASAATSASVQQALTTAATELSNATAQSLWANGDDPITPPYGMSVFDNSPLTLSELRSLHGSLPDGSVTVANVQAVEPLILTGRSGSPVRRDRTRCAWESADSGGRPRVGCRRGADRLHVRDSHAKWRGILPLIGLVLWSPELGRALIASHPTFNVFRAVLGVDAVSDDVFILVIGPAEAAVGVAVVSGQLMRLVALGSSLLWLVGPRAGFLAT